MSTKYLQITSACFDLKCFKSCFKHFGTAATCFLEQFVCKTCNFQFLYSYTNNIKHSPFFLQVLKVKMNLIKQDKTKNIYKCCGKFPNIPKP